MKFITREDLGITYINLVDDREVLLSVAPEHGAKLVSLKLKSNASYHETLWGMSAEDLKTNDWYKSAALFPYPNRLAKGRYHFEGEDYQFPINEPDKGNQLHGLIFDVPFEIASQEAGDDKAHVSLTYKYDGALDYYPFPFKFTITYTYINGSLEVRFDVENTGDRPLPYGIGWHPYFQIDQNNIHSYKLELPEVNIIELDQNAIPTGKETPYSNRLIDLKATKLDNGFRIVNGDRTYSLLDEKSGVRLKMEVSEDFDYIQVFTPPGDETVAIEPMTCNVNAFNNRQGLKVLNQGERFSASFRVSVAKL